MFSAHAHLYADQPGLLRSACRRSAAERADARRGTLLRRWLGALAALARRG